MRHINEILLDIQSGKWLRDKNFGLSLAEEFSEAYEHWMQTEHPSEYASASIRMAVRPFYRRVAIWLIDPKVKNDRCDFLSDIFPKAYRKIKEIYEED